MCFYPMFFEVFGEIFSSSPSLKCSAFGWEETLASLHNFDVRSGRLLDIFQKQTSPKPLLNYHFKTLSVGFYIQMILLELRLLIPLDPALCSVNLVGSGNISVLLWSIYVNFFWNFIGHSHLKGRVLRSSFWGNHVVGLFIDELLGGNHEKNRPSRWEIWHGKLWQFEVVSVTRSERLWSCWFNHWWCWNVFKRLFLGMMVDTYHLDWPSKTVDH